MRVRRRSESQPSQRTQPGRYTGDEWGLAPTSIRLCRRERRQLLRTQAGLAETGEHRVHLVEGYTAGRRDLKPNQRSILRNIDN